MEVRDQQDQTGDASSLGTCQPQSEQAEGLHNDQLALENVGKLLVALLMTSFSL